MTARPAVILALTPLAEREVEPLLFDTTDAPLALLSNVVEADELQIAVERETPKAVLLSPNLSGLTAGHCARVQATGVRLVGLALDDHDRETLDALSVDKTIDATVTRDELLTAVRGITGGTRPVPDTPAPSRPERREDGGSILTVVGTKGAPGASECAASLAALAVGCWPTVLVEADALGGGLDVRLGTDATQGSLLGLVRAAAGGVVQRELVERWFTEADGWPPVLLGPQDPQAHTELAQPGAMTGALHALAALYPLTVCDVGALLTDDGSSAAVRLHREALIAADAVLLVLGSRDIQLRHGLRQLDLLLGTLGIPAERLRIIANAIGAPGSASRPAITQTITAHLAERGVTVDAWLPWDARAATQAQRRGTPLATARKRSGYTRALTGLLDELFLPDSAPTPTPKRRKRRLTVSSHRHEHQEDEVALPWQS